LFNTVGLVVAGKVLS